MKKKEEKNEIVDILDQFKKIFESSEIEYFMEALTVFTCATILLQDDEAIRFAEYVKKLSINFINIKKVRDNESH